MTNGMIEIARRLSALKEAWKGLGVTSRDLATLGLPDKDSQFIEDIIDQVAGMASQLASSPTANLTMVQHSCEGHLKHLEAFFTAQARDLPSMRMLTFITLLLQMKSILAGAIAQSPEPRGGQNPTQNSA